MYWSHTLDDLRTLVNLKSQERMVGYLQEYETFRLVVDEALGGGAGSDHPTPSSSDHIQSFDQLTRAFAEVGGTVG